MVGSIYDFFTLPSQVREANIRKAILDGVINQQYNRQTGPDSWRNVNDGEARIIRKKDSIERIILRVAKEKKGMLTACDVALAADISIDEAKKDLDAMVSKGIAELRVRQSGTLVYTIPEMMMDKDDPLVD